MSSDPSNKYYRQNKKINVFETLQMEDWLQPSQQRCWPPLLPPAMFSVSHSSAPCPFLMPLANLNQTGQDWHLAPPEFYHFSGSQRLSGGRKPYCCPPRRKGKLSVRYLMGQDPTGCPPSAGFSTRTCAAAARSLQALTSCHSLTPKSRQEDTRLN